MEYEIKFSTKSYCFCKIYHFVWVKLLNVVVNCEKPLKGQIVNLILFYFSFAVLYEMIKLLMIYLLF